MISLARVKHASEPSGVYDGDLAKASRYTSGSNITLLYMACEDTYLR